mgnify:CR=1 FL=1
MSQLNKSYIYTGTVGHRRFTPFNHFFNYPLFMAYIDLNTINNLQKKSWLWNVNQAALISFHREDYHGEPDTDLSDSVRKTVYKSIGKKIKGPIRLLTHLRYFGYCFNPVSFYYCYDEKDSEVEVIMAEVTNTPWKERHPYIIHNKNDKKRNLKANFEKELHVSPFWGMDHNYEWLFSQPGKKLYVNMKNFKSNQKVFDATLTMERNSFTKKELIRQVIRFPFITMVVVFRIHFQAFKLWIKKAPFFVHPNKI